MHSEPLYVSLNIDLEKVKIDLNEELNVKNNNDEIPIKIAYWGSVLAHATEEQVKTNSEYRIFRAKISSDILVREPKLVEWKVKAAIECTKEFMEYKKKIANTTRNLMLARAILDAFIKKADLVKAKETFTGMELDDTIFEIEKIAKNDLKNEKYQIKMREIFSKKEERSI